MKEKEQMNCERKNIHEQDSDIIFYIYFSVIIG